MGASWWAWLDGVGFEAVRLLLSLLWQSSIVLGAAGLLAGTVRALVDRGAEAPAAAP